MDPRYPLGRPNMDTIQSRLSSTDRESACDALDRYDVEIPAGYASDDIREMLDADRVRNPDAVAGALRDAAREYEQDTGDVPDWVAAVNYTDLPGYDEPVREVFDHWSAKATYVDRSHDHVIQLPTLKNGFEERLEQVFTWQHNAEQISDAGLTPSGLYDDIRTTTIDGERLPYTVIPYRSDIQRYTELAPDLQADWHSSFESAAETMQALVSDGRVASAVPDDYWLGGTPSGNLVFDPVEPGVVVIDVGELHDGSWPDHDAIPYNTRDEFLDAHDIQWRIDAFRAAHE